MVLELAHLNPLNSSSLYFIYINDHIIIILNIYIIYFFVQSSITSNFIVNNCLLHLQTINVKLTHLYLDFGFWLFKNSLNFAHPCSLLLFPLPFNLMLMTLILTLDTPLIFCVLLHSALKIVLVGCFLCFFHTFWEFNVYLFSILSGQFLII